MGVFNKGGKEEKNHAAENKEVNTSAAEEAAKAAQEEEKKEDAGEKKEEAKKELTAEEKIAELEKTVAELTDKRIRLIAEMENHRSDLVVIMAGYTDEMQTLMRGNAGLASRMPYILEFPNFTREELYQIFLSMTSSKFKAEKETLECAKAYFESIPDSVLQSKEFSNARFVRNLYERTWAKAVMRCQLEKKKNITLTKDDFERSVADKEFKFNEKKKNRLGFFEN